MKTLKEIHQDLISKKITVRQLVDQSIETIKNNEKKFNDKVSEDKNLNAVIDFYSAAFINDQIDKAQKMIDEGKEELWTGVPILVKDNILVAGEKVSAGSKMLENYKATYDASIIEKLKEKGVILLGRTNMDEFAMGSSGETSAYGPAKNPVDLERVPGGSSAGSAASVAAKYVPLALGSDTGGSICLPSAFCNLVGFKPTYGSVSRYGLIAMGSSLDQIGTFTTNVDDAESFFDILSFFDKKDSTSIPEEKRKEINLNIKKKIGVPKILNKEEIKKGIDSKILEDFETQIKNFKTLGYEVKEVDIPNMDKALAIYYILCPAEVSSNMGRYDGVRYGLSVLGGNTVENFTNSRTAGLGNEVRRRILLGTYILSAGYFDAYYNKAVIAREILKAEFEKVFEEVDVVMTPTSAMLPWKFGEITNPLSMYLADLFTVPANIIGAPAISIPTTKREEVNPDNLPKAIHLIGNLFEDKKLLKISKDFEDFIQK
ncbi:Glutamyl-tRNA(Gln) amidotransferase subunit A [bioreactor metagenome]|uniref:Glutamyl-tRNA(Gln) amidotransferase subunit A n=1 Tax=bioreactor metagenome TaxID=1076179 RepID=A0A644T6C9_9ZZZZ|nr:Asp-tRNA(Asn)/Glu-tRNA(Gln) amidotransferase subunit GatA [Candidatus Elulimicrobiales bacterium]